LLLLLLLVVVVVGVLLLVLLMLLVLLLLVVVLRGGKVCVIVGVGCWRVGGGAAGSGGCCSVTRMRWGIPRLASGSCRVVAWMLVGIRGRCRRWLGAGGCRVWRGRVGAGWGRLLGVGIGSRCCQRCWRPRRLLLLLMRMCSG
jgi:hypothetical protein